MRRLLPVLVLLLLPMLLFATGSAQTEAGYILEAEYSSGDWSTGPVKKTPYWDTQNLDLLPDLVVDRLYDASYTMGATVTAEEADGATSSIQFTPPEPGYYLIGARMSTREAEDEGFGGQSHVTVMMRDGDGTFIPNELEVQALGYTWDVPVAAPVIGMWNLPAEPVTLIFQAQVSRLIFLDYFYLTPLFEAGSAPRAYLPAVPWPAEGDWSWGEHLDFMVTVSTMPGESSTVPLYALIAGDYILYVYTWHDGEYEQVLDLQVGTGEEAFTTQITLPEGMYWKMAKIGPIPLAEGEIPLSFTNNLANPQSAVLAIETIHMVPLGHILDVLPDSYRREGVLRLDGLGDEWADTPAFLLDPQGDQSLNSDIKEVRASVANGTLNLMVEFYELSKHSGFVLDVDFDGNEEPEYVVEANSMGHWALINYPDMWMHAYEIACATFDVMEISIPIELLEPFQWEDHPETLSHEFNLEEAIGFYVRYRLTNHEEPYELDETDWAYIEISDSWGGCSDETEGEESGGVAEEPMDEPPDEGEELEDERPRGITGFIQDAISSILKLLESLLSWIQS